MAGIVELIFDLHRVIAAEVHRSRAPRRSRSPASCRPRAPPGPSAPASGLPSGPPSVASRRRVRPPTWRPSRRLAAPGPARGPHSAALASITRPTRSSSISRVAYLLHFAIGDIAVAQHWESAPLLLRTFAGLIAAWLHMLAGQVQARVLRCWPYSSNGAGIFFCAAGRHGARPRPPDPPPVRLWIPPRPRCGWTKELLAPFSSKRRTR